MQVTIPTFGSVMIEDTPIGNGGEGTVHRFHPGQSGVSTAVQQQLRHLVVKKYLDQQKAIDRVDKIKFMVSNRPQGVGLGQADPDIIWPIDIVNDTAGAFIGFVMPLACQGGIELNPFKFPYPVSQKNGPQWQKFDHGEPGSFERRLKVLRNLAVAMHNVHAAGCYVFMDMKPMNVMIKPTGLVELIDMDSLQIAENGIIRFPGAVCTPDYSPPEFQKGIVGPGDVIGVEWTHFIFAVMAYQVLFSIHPFAGSYKKSSFTDLEGAIENNCFAHGRNANQFDVIPAPHATFSQLPDSLKALFVKAFDDGHDDPKNRPSLLDWYTEIEQAVGQKQCQSINVAKNLPMQPVTPQFQPQGAGQQGQQYNQPLVFGPAGTFGVVSSQSVAFNALYGAVGVQFHHVPVLHLHSFTYVHLFTKEIVSHGQCVGQELWLFWSAPFASYCEVYPLLRKPVPCEGQLHLTIFKSLHIVLNAYQPGEPRDAAIMYIAVPNHSLNNAMPPRSANIPLQTGTPRILAIPRHTIPRPIASAPSPHVWIQQMLEHGNKDDIFRRNFSRPLSKIALNDTAVALHDSLILPATAEKLRRLKCDESCANQRMPGCHMPWDLAKIGKRFFHFIKRIKLQE